MRTKQKAHLRTLGIRVQSIRGYPVPPSTFKPGIPPMGKVMIAAALYFLLMAAFLWSCILTGNFPLNM